MCRICTQAKTLPAAHALQVIAEAQAKGKDPEHFKKALDTILGTEEQESDPVRDEVWERSRRG